MSLNNNGIYVDMYPCTLHAGVGLCDTKVQHIHQYLVKHNSVSSTKPLMHAGAQLGRDWQEFGADPEDG